MSWIFAVIGFIVGLVIGFINDLPAFLLGTLCAIAAYAVCRMTTSKKNRPSPPAGEQADFSAGDGSRRGSLADRVLRLEREIVMLRNEVQRLRGADLPPVTAPAYAALAAASPAYQASADLATQEARPDSEPATASADSQLPATEAAEFTQERAAPPPRPPRQPDLIDHIVKAARGWLFGGNTVVRVGIIVLFFGIAFLLKYAADNSMLPVEFRLAGVALAATALLVIGWRLRGRRLAYGLVLQGGGVGILYLTVFAATRLYALLPAGAAFPLMVAICMLSAFLAVRQNASSLAFMGSMGGFLAPVLLSTGGGSHIVLFGYYALLDAGIFAIAWFKAWRPLNLLGFVFTFLIGAAWGFKAYQPGLFASTEFFLILFFLMYVGIALLYAVRREIALKHYVDGTLVFGTPLVAIALQAGLVRDIDFGLAWSAVALSAFYLGVAAWLRGRRERLGLLFESMLAVALIFATLAVPLAFTGPTTSAVWAVEGAAVVWLGMRQHRLTALGFGLLLQLAAGTAFFARPLDPGAFDDGSHLPILNGIYIGTLLLAIAGMFSGWRLHGTAESRAWRERHGWLPQIGIVAAIWGLFWWISGGLAEVFRYFELRDFNAAGTLYKADTIALFAVVSAWLAYWARRRLAWTLAAWPALALVPVLAVLAAVVGSVEAAPLTGMGAIAWPVAAVAAYLLLWRQQRDTNEPLLKPLHTLMFWTLCWLLALEGYWRLRDLVPEGAWAWSAWAYGFGILLLLLAGPGARLRWPVMRYARAYLLWGAAPLALLLWGWSIGSVLSDGDAAPLFYLPILNPLDVAQLLAFMAVAVWLKRLAALGVTWRRRIVDYAALATVFLWFNALLLRTMHHRFGAPYNIDAVLTSFGRQQVLLLGWSAFAFAGLRFARRDSTLRLFAIASAPIVVLMWLWTFIANFTQEGGNLSRLPLLNPLDLVQVAIYGMTAFWLSRLNRVGMPIAPYRVPLRIAAAATLFVWLNAMLLRTLHHWTGVPYTLEALSQSTLVQASVSVFWTVCALTATILATRRASRLLWFTGGGLLALTVVKLFLFDLSHLNGIVRIVSFIGIGVMLLLIGYFSPLPPKSREAAT